MYMKKEDAHKALLDGETLYVPTWYFTMYEDGRVYATCGEDNCCENDFDTFDEFWDWYGDEEMIVY